jgi:hypothetical protein
MACLFWTCPEPLLGLGLSEVLVRVGRFWVALEVLPVDQRLNSPLDELFLKYIIFKRAEVR